MMHSFWDSTKYTHCPIGASTECLAGFFLISDGNILAPSGYQTLHDFMFFNYTSLYTKDLLSVKILYFFKHVSNTFGQRTYKWLNVETFKTKLSFSISNHYTYNMKALYKKITLIYIISLFIVHDLDILPDGVK